MRRALLAERLLNARRTHLVRALALGFFVGLFVLLNVVRGDAAWNTDFTALFVWAGLAVLFVFGSCTDDTVGEWLVLVPAIVDMPFIYWVQRAQYATTPSPSGVAGFSMGLFALLLAIAALSSVRWQIWFSAASAAMWEVLLQSEAGVSVGAMVSAVVVLGLTAFMLTYASDRRYALLVQIGRREKLAALGQLSAGVGHDLRNPLAAVSNAVFVLRRRLEKLGPLATSVEQPLALAEREVRASQRIVTDLLDYAREMPMQLEPVSIPTLLEECTSLVRGRPEVQLKLELRPELPQPPGERDRLRQVFVNLLQNGVEAIPAGRAGIVRVTAAIEGRQLAVNVHDDGVGMDEATRARVFEPLFTTKKDGTGLGLAIVESLVRQHGGTLVLKSAPGQGATFTVRLPLR
ncbi:MAG: sensor histidine kinase [Archangium sp.]